MTFATLQLDDQACQGKTNRNRTERMTARISTLAKKQLVLDCLTWAGTRINFTS